MSLEAEVNNRPAVMTTQHPSWSAVRQVWAELNKVSGCSFFLSSEWMETWLEVFGSERDLSFLVFEEAHEPVAACLLVESRSHLVGPQRLWLNATGEPAADTIYSEQNNLLARPGWESEAAQALASYLCTGQWDQLVLSGFTPGAAYDTLVSACRGRVVEEIQRPSYYVDLAEIRHAGTDYIGFLKGKRGKHLRRELRHEGLGPLRLELARSVGEALTMLDQLSALSQARWASLKGRSIFSSSEFGRFHRRLIERCFDLGAIQMARVWAGEDLLGVLYNFVHRGKVYFYQCGYNYTADKRLSPGKIALALAIQHSLEAGYTEFDLLSGTGEYKRKMALGVRTVNWATVRNNGIRSKIRSGFGWLAGR
jgi:CelD/BcsL family acetyltransferase involved in cellulose biosynthesis